MVIVEYTSLQAVQSSEMPRFYTGHNNLKIVNCSEENSVIALFTVWTSSAFVLTKGEQ